MGVLSTYQEQLQDMVNKGIDAAEKQQKRLSAKPFDLAEKLEESARARSVKSLRKSYYGYSENVFDQLRELNVMVGEFTAQLISRVEKEVAEGADSVVEGAVEVAQTAEDVKVAVQPAKTESKDTAEKTPTAKAVKTEDSKVVKAEDSKAVKAEDSKAVKAEDSKEVKAADAKPVKASKAKTEEKASV